VLALEEGQRLTRLTGSFVVARRVGGWPALCPSAFRSLVRQTRKALESETFLAGHSYCGFGRGVGCGG
jgi:hypothetical protein